MSNVISWHSMGLSALYAYFFTGPQGLTELEAAKRHSDTQPVDEEYRRLLRHTLLGLPAVYLSALFVVTIAAFYNSYYFAAGLSLITSLLYAWVFLREARQRVNWAVTLMNINREKVLVYRDGIPKHHLPEDLVLGDVIVLRPPMILPATVRLIEAKDLYVASDIGNESFEKHATNFKKEENIVTKVLFPKEEWEEKNPVNVVAAGSLISEGEGKGIIIDIPKNNHATWIVEKFHVESLINLKDKITLPLMLMAVLVPLLFIFIGMILDDRTHGLAAIILAGTGFLVLLFPVTADLLKGHYANLQMHELLRKHIIIRNSKVFHELMDTSLVVADAEYLSQQKIPGSVSDIWHNPSLKLFIFTSQSKEWLEKLSIEQGWSHTEIITHNQFSSQNDRQIEELLESNHFFAEVTENDKRRLFEIIKSSGKHFILVGEKTDDESVIPADLRLLLAEQTTSSLTKNATDILLLSNNVNEFLSILVKLQKGRDKIRQNESFLKTLHLFCATGVILAFLIGGGVGELIAFSLLILLGLWNTFSISA